MWVKVEVCGSIHTAMKWQPMPACARDPSGTRVEVLCGQPEQKYGIRLMPSLTFDSKCGGVNSTTCSRLSSAGLCCASQSATTSIKRDGRNSPTAEICRFPDK